MARQAKFPGWRHMTRAQRYNARMNAMFERAGLHREYRAQEALPVDGKPSWYGQYRPESRAPWRTASSDYGCIRYTTPEYAVAGAKVYAEQREKLEPK